MITREKVLHDLNAIEMTMKMQCETEYNDIKDNFNTVKSYLNQTPPTNTEVEELIKIIEVEVTLNPNNWKHTTINSINTIKSHITQMQQEKIENQKIFDEQQDTMINFIAQIERQKETITQLKTLLDGVDVVEFKDNYYLEINDELMKIDAHTYQKFKQAKELVKEVK